MEGPYSARLPSARSGEKSRRAPADRETANGRANHYSELLVFAVIGDRYLSC